MIRCPECDHRMQKIDSARVPDPYYYCCACGRTFETGAVE
jgi:DNA-directed RNA polymerase subunit RPC12/RpoP